MRHIFIWLLLAGFASPPFVQGQPCPDSVGISTDPRPGKAFNLERPGLLNTFDWFSNNTLWPINLYGPYQSLPAFSNPFYNNNSDLNYLAHGLDSDFHPEDGWELIQWGFGMQVKGSTEFSHSGHTRGIPVLILYNRYSGMLHVFGAYHDYSSNVMEIELRFTRGSEFEDGLDPGRPTYKPAGMLAYANSIAQPLDHLTNISSVKSRFPFPNDPLKFTHAAFPIAYDPCVCQNDVAFRVNFTPISFSDVDLYGRTASTSYSPAEYYNGGAATFQDFLNAVHTDGSGNIVAGTQVYQDVTKMYDDLIAEMNAEGSFDVVAALDVLKADLELRAEILGPIKIPGTDIGASYPLKVAAKKINYQQSIIKFRKSGQAPEPSLSLPAIIRGESKMSGTITNIPNAQLATEFAVPGSQGSWNLPETNYPSDPYYPLYNEELGVFALLETPTVDRESTVSSPVNGQICSQGPLGEPLVYEQIVQEEIRYRLGSDVKYAINPAARLNLSDSDISAALMIKNKPRDNYLSTGTYYMINETIHNLEPSSTNGYQYISPFLPLECLGELTLYIQREHRSCNFTDWFPSADTVYLVFANSYLSSQPDQDGLPILSQQILTFPVNLNQGATVPNSVKVPFEAEISGTISNDISAWREIRITDDITAVGTISLNAGQLITIEPNADVTSGFNFQTGYSGIVNCGSVNEPFSPNQLVTYCSSSTYKANQLSRLGQQYVENEANTLAEARIPLTLFPNPVSEFVTLRYELPQKARTSVEIRDLMGRVVWQTPEITQAAGPHEQQLDVHMFSSGVYLLTLKAGNQNQTIRMVKE